MIEVEDYCLIQTWEQMHQNADWAKILQPVQVEDNLLADVSGSPGNEDAHSEILMDSE